MIDYLSPLLEEETSLDWQEPVRVPAADRKGSGAPDPEDPAAAGVAPPTQTRTQVQGHDLANGEAPDRDLLWGEPLEKRTLGAAVLAQRLRRTGRVSRLAQGGRTAVTVTLPDQGGTRQSLDLLELDRAVQRDARRYDGGFPFY